MCLLSFWEFLGEREEEGGYNKLTKEPFALRAIGYCYFWVVCWCSSHFGDGGGGGYGGGRLMGEAPVAGG